MYLYHFMCIRTVFEMVFIPSCTWSVFEYDKGTPGVNQGILVYETCSAINMGNYFG